MNVEEDKQQRGCNSTDRPGTFVIKGGESNVLTALNTYKLMKKHHLHDTCCVRVLVHLALMVDISNDIVLHHQ